MKNKKLWVVLITIIVLALTIIIFIFSKEKEKENDNQWYEPNKEQTSTSQSSEESTVSESNTEEKTKETENSVEYHDNGSFTKLPNIQKNNENGGLDSNDDYYKMSHEVKKPESEQVVEEINKPYNDRDYSKIRLSFGEFEYVLKNMVETKGFEVIRVLTKDENLIIGIKKDKDITTEKVKENAKNFLNNEVLSLVPCSPYQKELWINDKNAIKIMWDE